MRELPDDTKKLISDAIKSDSAPISCKDARKKKGKKGVVKSAAVIAAYAGDSLGGVVCEYSSQWSNARHSSS